jgi:small subunit ribosomal protein S13
MARIAGINIPDEKRIEIALTYVYGIGRSTSAKIIREAGIDPSTRVKDLNTQSLEKLRSVIEKNSKVEGELRMSVSQNIKRLKEIGTYRGVRHIKNLPARGQRTKTNARTKRGKRVCVGSGRRAAAEKT